MQLQIRNENRDDMVDVWLEPAAGNIQIMAARSGNRDADEGWVLGAITKLGIELTDGVSDELGFPLDTSGRIKII